MIYTICKGCQYSNGISIGSPHTGKTFQEYLVKFSKSCLTLTGVKNCDGDWNKLFGWGYGLHQRNSLRLVWKSLNGKIRIGWYVYESGVRKYDGFASVEAEASNNLIDANYKRFTLASKQILWHIARRLQEHGYTTDFRE